MIHLCRLIRSWHPHSKVKACKYLLIRQTQSHIITDVQFHVHITTLHFKKAIWHNQGSCCLNVIFEMTEITIQTNCATPMVSRHDSTPSRTCRLVFCGSSSNSRNARSSTCDACRMSCFLCHHMAGLIEIQKQIYQRQCAKIPLQS